MSNIRTVRGMNDLLPDQSPAWQYVERQLRSLVDRYDYREIRTPIVEQTALFARSIGEATDVVEIDPDLACETATYAQRTLEQPLRR